MRFRAEERICVSVVGKNSGEAIQSLAALKEVGVKMVELRLDYLLDNNYLSVLKEAYKNGFEIVSTVRNKNEGGTFSGSEEERKRILLESASIASYIDIEYDTYICDKSFIDRLKINGAKIILSKHFMWGHPPVEELEKLLSEMRHVGDFWKIITYPSHLFEATNLLSLYRYDWVRGRLIAFCMGDEWALTRLLSIFLGAPFTYVHSGSRPVAPGQLSYIELKKELEKLSWLAERCHF